MSDAPGQKTFNVASGPDGFVVTGQDDQKLFLSITPEGVKIGDVVVPPLLCGNCRTLFRLAASKDSRVEMTGEFVFSESGDVDWRNVQIGPCPTCGGKGVVRQALFGAAKESLVALAGLGRDELSELGARISALKAVSNDPEAVSSALDATPLGPVIRTFATQGNRMELLTLLQVLGAAISILLAMHGSGSSTTVSNNITINEVIPTVAASSDSVDWRQVQRNGPCPCGSGLKAKKCHLVPEQMNPEPWSTSSEPSKAPTAASENTKVEGSTNQP